MKESHLKQDGLEKFTGSDSISKGKVRIPEIPEDSMDLREAGKEADMRYNTNADILVSKIAHETRLRDTRRKELESVMSEISDLAEEESKKRVSPTTSVDSK